ncbi:non-ribosomal peptide synthetase, partial [Streptomyces clavuligerus]|uniref:non-ribosomal peptide synthetase n=1 Tax=Streptomyces clavuligerus TaxID=1901 RepID=UPI0018D17D72
LNRPALTAERFLPDPYGAPGSRLYRSGDIALRRPDGSLEVIGRIDDQVKIRGFRIELGEITAALTNHPDIRQAITIVREDTPGDKRLVAYLVPEPGHLLNTPAIRQDLTQSLPDYMVPTAYIPLDAIPLTANGKLDKRNLPAPDSATLRTADTYTAPRTPLEQHIAEVWRDVLGVDRVGVHDSFFELGGDSLRAVTLVGALRTAGYEVSVRDIFDARTVARLGELTGEAQGHSVVQRLVQPFELISAEDRALLPEDVADAYPLSQNQLGMVVEMLTDDAQNNYHNVSSYWIRDAVPFSAAAFAAAGRVLVERHEALRTSIQLSGYSRPLQLVHQHAEMVTRTIDLTGQDKDSVWAEVRRFATAERADAFDMSVPGLMRYHAHTTSDDGWWLSITECHPIMEGWSYHSLIMELLTTYFALRDGQEPAYEGTPDVRFADAIAAELAALESTEDRAYWNGVVQDHAPLRLPENWGTPEAGAFDAHKGAFPFQHIEPQLRALATATETSLKAVMVAAHLKVMSQLTGEQDFHTGLVCDMRPEMVGADRVAGMYLNTLPFPFRRTARTWGELVRQVFDTEVGLWPHRRYPMPTVQRAWGGTGRMMDVYFNYHDFRQVDTELIDIMAGNDDSPTEFPLTVSSRSGHIILTANRRHIDEINVERLVGMYGAVLEAMAAEGISGDARVTRLPDHEHTLVTTGPVSAPSIDGYPLMHGLFEAMVAERPDAVAVVADGTQYTYAEVNERANRIAHLLRSLGARPEDAIGVHLERGPDLIPALLGVLKSGAGYLPLDPVNPVDRLGYIVSDAQARLVITTSDLAPTLTTVYDGQLIVLDTTDLTDLPTENPAVVSSAENAIYTIYTSGSTGRPKGVVLTHTNVARLLTTAQEHFAFDHTDVWSMAHSYAFDVSVFEMWGALAHGGQLIVVPRAVTRSPEEFADLLTEHHVTVLSQTPTAFSSLTALAAANDPRINQLHLRAVIFAGEKLEISGLRPWVDRKGLTAPVLVNMYGITETTVHTTYHALTEQDLEADGNPIGRPLSDLAVHLLNTDGRPVPLGVPGEIHVSGPGVARGYLNRPSLTAERFLPDPYGPPGSRMYRSGDIALRNPDATLDFSGRIDDQVKIRGFRIELGEITAALTNHPDIRQAITIVREDTPGDKRLVAYLVPEPGHTPDAKTLRTELATTLPDY